MFPSKNNEKEKARELYLNSQMTQTEIAAEVGVSERIMSIWAKKGAWRALKENSLRVPAILADALYYELEEINMVIMGRSPGKRFATPQEAESRRRIITSIGLLKKQLTTPEAAQVIKSFQRYVYSQDMIVGKVIGRLANSFIQIRDVLGYRPFDIEYNAGNEEFLNKEEQTDELSEQQPNTNPNINMNIDEHKTEPS